MRISPSTLSSKVGNAYAVRTDGEPFTVAEWCRLDDVGLNSVMDHWGEGEGPPTAAFYEKLKRSILRSLGKSGGQRGAC
jgi:hypothetical protein